MNTPKFKEGEWIKRKEDGRTAQVLMLLNTCYSLRFADDYGWYLDYDSQDNWEITSNPNEESGSSETPNDLEETANNYLDGVYGKMPHSDFHIAIFIAGAKWQMEKDLSSINKSYESGVVFGMNAQKEQMMKEAVEGEVMTTGFSTCDPVFIIHRSELSPETSFKDGQKVRIIIVKGD